MRRGVTRIKELTENGLNVSFGNDDIFDPWYPMEATATCGMWSTRA